MTGERLLFRRTGKLGGEAHHIPCAALRVELPLVREDCRREASWASESGCLTERALSTLGRRASFDREPMKTLHQPTFFSWSRFDEARNVDFHGYAIIRPGGVVLVDPMPMSAHDLAHLDALGTISAVMVTNSDHTRAAQELAARSNAELLGPRAEAEGFPIPCSRFVGEGDEVAPGIVVMELHGSKTPGELALVVDDTTLITGDLVRAHRAGALTILPDAKLADRALAVASVRRLAALDRIDAVLVGDGWPVFRDGHRALVELAGSLES